MSQSLPKQHHKKLSHNQELTYFQILAHHHVEQSPDVLLGNQKDIWRLLIEQIELFYKETNKQKKESVIFVFRPACKRVMLHYRLHCLCFISFSSVHTLLFMFYLYSVTSAVHLIHFQKSHIFFFLFDQCMLEKCKSLFYHFCYLFPLQPNDNQSI